MFPRVVFDCRLIKYVAVLKAYRSAGNQSASYSIDSLYNLVKNMQTEKEEKRKRVQVAADNLRNIRIEKKSNSKKYPPSHIYLQVLGNNKPGVPSCLYVFTNSGRYIFNCGEGTQRISTEFKLKLSVLEHIFLTSSTWKSLGGLPGLSLTLHDMGLPEMNIHSTPGIEELFQRMSYFVPVVGMKVNEVDTSKNEFSDEVFSVTYVPINSGIGKVDMCYVCKIHPKKGSLMPSKCAEMGINPGPIFSQLKNGESVTLPNGKIIHPSDVCLPDDPGPIFLVIESTSLESVANLSSLKGLMPYLKTGSDSSRLTAIVHFTDSSLASNPQYINWMKEFPCHTNHIFLNDFCPDYGSESIYRMQYKLNQVDKTVFPLLHQNKTNTVLPECFAGFNAVIGQTMLKYCLRPDIGFDHSCIPEIKPQNYIDEVKNVNGFEVYFENYLEDVGKVDDPKYKDLEYPKVIFLGTGSCIPNKARNTSGIIVCMSAKSNMLLDVGEGTVSQIFRVCGEAGAHALLVDLKSIYISHMHADHHIGLIGVLQERRKAFEVTGKPFFPLYLFAPNNIMSWLDYYDQNYESIADNYIMISNMNLLNFPNVLVDDKSIMDTLEDMGLAQIKTCYVKHCPHSYGVSMVTTNGFKLVYSGDCRPDDRLVELGMNCDLLIHEATLEDMLLDEAKVKMHCTTSEAVEIGQKMKANYIILTHFSQRYARLPMIKDLENNTNVGIAYDFMRISPRDFKKLPHLIKLLIVVFSEYYEELEMKSEKKVQQRKKAKLELEAKT